MNEQYIKDLYQQLVSIDPLFANDVSFDKFVNSVKDPSYASSLYSQLNQIDNTFKNDVSLDSFLGAVGAGKKKDATAISAGSTSASTSPQVSSSVSSSSQNTQPSPDLQKFAERFMPQQQPTQYPDITGTSVIDVNEFGSPLSQKKKVITVSEADRRKWSGPMEDSNIFASFKNTIETPIQPEETAQQKKEKISFIHPLINSLDSDFVQLDEEAAVPKLQYLFGPLGFKFEESGLGDYVTVTAPDNTTKTTIPLDPFFGMGAAKNSEALKNFVRTNAQEIPKEKLDRISNQYVNENKKYATEQEYDNDIKYINDESNKIITEEASISKEYAKLNAERDAINAVPQSQRNNPQYIEKARDLQLRLNALQERVDFIDESKRKLNTSPLMRATGQYAEMKSKQGDPIGAFANNILNGFGRELSSMVSNYIQGVAEAQPNWYLFDKSGRNRDMAFKIAQEKGLKPIESGQEFMNWFNSLPSDAQKEISGTVRDKEIKSVKYGDEFGGGVTEKIRPVITNLFGDKSVTQEYIKDVERNNFVGGAVLGAAQSIPAMIGPKYMRIAGMFLQGSDFIDEEIQNNPESKNLTEREKAAIKTVIGVPVALLEDYGFRNLIGNSSVVSNLIFRALGKGGVGITGKTFAEFVRNDIESGLLRAGLTAAGGAAAEFETGLFQQAWENTVKAVYNEVNSKVMNNPEQRKIFNSPDFWSGDMLMDVFKGGAQEAIGGLVLGVPNTISAGMRSQGFKGISDSQFKVFEEMANDDNILNAWISSLKAKVANGDLKPAEAKEQLNDYRNAVGLYRQLPDNLTTQQKKEAMNLIRERNVIQQQIENKDPQLTRKQRDRINQINEQLKVLPENAIQEPEAEGSMLRPEQPEVGLQEVGKGDTQGKETTGAATQEQVIITDEDKARRQSLTDALFIAEELGDDKVMVGDTEMSLQDAKQELADLTLKEEKSKQAPAPAPTAEVAAPAAPTSEQATAQNFIIEGISADVGGYKTYTEEAKGNDTFLRTEANKNNDQEMTSSNGVGINGKIVEQDTGDGNKNVSLIVTGTSEQEGRLNDHVGRKAYYSVTISLPSDATVSDNIRQSLIDKAAEIAQESKKTNPSLRGISNSALQKAATTQVSPTAEPTAPIAEQVAPAAPVAEKQNLMSQRNTDLFPDAINFAQEDNDSKLSDYAEANGIGVATYTNPENGLVDTIMTGTSDNDFVGFIRIYENGKPTNKFSSKMSNESGNKENFKTMLSEAQKRLPEGHLYTEKTSVSIDGIRVFSNQLNRGYEVATDENGNPITQDVTLNNASVEGLRNARNQNQKEALYNNKFVKTQEEFEQIKAKILELMPQAKVTFNKPIGRVTISLPVLKSTTTQAAPAVTTTEQVAPTTTEQVAPAPVAELTIAPTSTPSAYAATQGLAEVETMVAEQERTATTKEQKQNVNTRKRIVATAKRAVNTLKSLFPNAEIFIHTDDNAYKKAMDTYNGNKDSNGNFARWVDADGKENVRIDINLNTATARTVAHEVAHAVLYKAFRDNPQVYKAFHKKLSAILKADANETLNNFSNRYTEELGYTELDRAEEFIVELAGMLEQNQTSIKPSTFQKIAKLINDVVSKLTNGAVKPFEEAIRTIEDAKDVVTFMSNLADAIREGKAISVEQKQGEEGGAEVVSKASIKDIDVNKIRTLSRAGNRVSKGLSIKDVKKQKIVQEAEDLSLEYVREKAPKIFIENANLIAKYPIVKGVKKFGEIKNIQDAQKVYDIFIRQVADNLKFLMDNFKKEFKDIATLWYDGANILAQNFSKKYGISTEQAAGIIACLSPQKDWYQNVRLAEMVMMAFKDNPIMTNDMVNKQKEIIAIGLKEYTKELTKAKTNYEKNKSEDNAKSLKEAEEAFDDYNKKTKIVLENLNNLIGTDMNSAPNYMKQYFVRLFHEINTTKDYDILSPDGKVIGVAKKKNGTKAKVAWGSYTEIGKAVSIYLDGSQENITRTLGEMHKIRNFYNNIIDPMSPDRDVTMDTHAVAAALLLPLSGKTKQVKANFGTGTKNSSPLGIKGLYYAYAEGYNLAAAETGLLPRQVQSITWEAVRGLFTDDFKRDRKKVEAINQIIDKYVNKKITLDEARNQITEYAGGIKDPSWAGGPVQEESTSNAEPKTIGRRSKTDGLNIVRTERGTDRGNIDAEFISKASLSNQTPDDIVKRGRANGVSEDAIRKVLENKGIETADIDKALGKVAPAGTKIELSEETLPGYNKLVNRINGIIERGRKKGYSDQKIRDNVVKNVQANDPAYAAATNVQQEQIIRDIDKQLGQKQKSAPSKEKVLGKEKKMVTVDDAAALADQIRLEARAAREAKMDLNKWRDLIGKYIGQMQTIGKITTAQAQAIVRKISKLNVDNLAHVEKFIQYMEKVFADAEYDTKLQLARKNIKKLKDLANNKKKDVNLTTLAKEFLRVDPSLVEDIDRYNAIAASIIESLQGSKITNKKEAEIEFARMVSQVGVMDYVNREVALQQELQRKIADKIAQEQFGVEEGDLTYDQIQELLAEENTEAVKKYDNIIRAKLKDMFDGLSAVIKSMIEQQEDPFTYERTTFTDSEKKTINNFMSMDINKLSLKEALRAVDALHNFIVNRSTASMGAIYANYIGNKNISQLIADKVRAKALKLFGSEFAGELMTGSTAQISMVFERLFKSANIGRRVQKMSGLTDAINGFSKAETDTNNIVNEYVDTFYKRKANGEEFNTAFNDTERGMVAFMSRTVFGTKAMIQDVFNARKKIIEDSIKELSKGTSKEAIVAELYQKVYDKILADSNNSQEVRDKADPTNIEAVNFWVSQWDSKFDALADISERIYNTILEKFAYYTPDRYSKLVLGGVKETTEEDILASSFINKNGGSITKEAKSLMAAKKQPALPKGRYINLSFDSVNSDAMRDVLVDENTAAPIRQILAFIDSPKLIELIPNNDDRVLLISRIKLYLQTEKNAIFVENTEVEKAAKIFSKFLNFGASLVLSSLRQAPQQVIPVLVDTFINTGKINFYDYFNVNKYNLMKNSGHSIANRLNMSATDVKRINELLDYAASSKLEKSLEAIAKVNDIYLKAFLAKPDAFAAQSSWILYYEKSLKKQGVYTNDYYNNPLNEEAADYASFMVDRTQNPSNQAQKGRIFTYKDAGKNAFMRVLFTLASFRMNTTNRIHSDIIALTSKTATFEDRRTHAASLAGAVSGSIIFVALSSYIAYLSKLIIRKLMGRDDDEEEKDKILKKTLKGGTTRLASDILSPVPILDSYINKGINYAYEKYKLNQGVDPKEIESPLYDFEDSKTFGIAGEIYDRAGQLIDVINMVESGEYVDKYGQTHKVTEEDREYLKKYVITPAVLNIPGLLPGESEAFVRGSIKVAQGGEKEEKEKRKAAIEPPIPAPFKTWSEVERNEPELYKKLMGPGSPGYKEREAEKKAEREEREAKEAARDIQLGYQPKPKGGSGRSSGGSSGGWSSGYKSPRKESKRGGWKSGRD